LPTAPPALPASTWPAPLAALSAGDPALDRQLARAARLVDSPVSVLITGETGSGKEWLAQALHAAGARRGGPFVAVNCAAIPESLIESELFGHLPGSFSGASPKGQKGLVQAADGGTLFLDEIGDMPRALQARLLRVLAEREVLPVGATRPVRVDLRVIAATHGALEAQVRAGSFRADLFHRLNGVRLQLPPLRERQDLDGLIARMLDAAGTQPRVTLDPAARAALHAHRWPGNLRELRNALDGARALCSDGVIRLEDLPDAVIAALDATDAAAPVDPLGDGEGARAAPSFRAPTALGPPATPEPGESPASATPPDDPAEALRQALQAARWNVSAVARALGCSRMTLYRRMKRLGLRSPLD
jgi:transcriptional regulator of acetoin/glycerol metabolism